MAEFQPADNLRSRTFLGLLLAQFLAAFNDQAIHASAMFFAINTGAMDEAQAISLMPILFYAPWALFCTLAGFLADRFSKRTSLVFWKVAEIGITLVALAGFWLGRGGSAAGPFIVLSTVFLMGMHSAFFVPAKYGAMPEILQPHMLSRGNGLLESLSFLAVILGTVFGGVLSDERVFGGREYWIGVVLVGLAVLGAAASLLIRRMPAANPGRRFPPYLYKPLWDNVRLLLRSRPLVVSVVGIAFFTFLVAFMRATVYMHGESQVPHWSESYTSVIVGMVALGIGLGSPLVGFLSGGKVELGLVPIGSVGMIVATFVAGAFLGWIHALVVCIIAIGFFTGFYIVPLFTLLQHRAPKTSKGDSIATSNFINVVGAMAASLLFFLLVFAAEHLGVAPELEQRTKAQGALVDVTYKQGRPEEVVLDPAITYSYPKDGGPPTEKEGRRTVRTRSNGKGPTVIDPEEYGPIDAFGAGLMKGEKVIVSEYKLGNVRHYRLRRADQPLKPVYDNHGLPSLLFAAAGLMTLFTLLLLWWLLPDLFRRTLLWLRMHWRYRLEVAWMNHLPDHGPVVLATNAEDAEPCGHVLSATDRTTRFLVPGDAPDWEEMALQAVKVLARGEVVGLPLGNGLGPGAMDHLLDRLVKGVPVLPVYYQVAPPGDPGRRRRVYVFAGTLLPAGTSAEVVRQELQRLGENFRRQAREGLGAGRALSGIH
jgi:MFS family permease